MAELLLIVSLLGIFAFGFYLMSRLDRFLEKTGKALLKENKILIEFSVNLAAARTSPTVRY